ncbi:MAG TPA: pitrilysin family protein [bacterium]|nr:pitrilysin family protein [bacterium]
MDKYQLTKLSNGIPVLLLPQEHTRAVSLFVTAKVGSRYENPKISGISHFIEHLMFKGTKKRPDKEMLAKELDSIGANFNAFTGKDRTVYFITANHKHLAQIQDILADMVQASLFPEKELAPEKKVVIEEINMYEDNPMMSIEDFLENLVFGDNALGRDIAGTVKTVSGITHKDVLNYYRKYYQSGNYLLVLTGNFKVAEAKKMLEEYWGKLPAKPRQNYNKIVVKSVKPQFVVKHKDTQQIQLALGFPGIDYNHKDAVAAQILALILGGNMSSRLFLEIREKRGLCYLVRAYHNFYEDNGMLVVQAGLDKSRLEEAVQAILGELKKIATVKVSAEELKKAKSFLEGKFSIETESARQLASWYSTQITFMKKVVTPDEYLKMVNKVSVDDIKRVASFFFKNNKLNLAMIGDVPKLPWKNILKFD